MKPKKKKERWKPKTQRAVITLKDAPNGEQFTATVTFEPSMLNRKRSDGLLVPPTYTPAVNAAYRIGALIQAMGQKLGQSLEKRIEPEETKRIITL
jgi:hypothetical protein